MAPLGGRQPAGRLLGVGREPELELGGDDVRRHLVAAGGALDGRIGARPARRRPGQPPVAVPAARRERLVAHLRARVRRGDDGAAADVHADVVRRPRRRSGEDEVAGQERLGRLRRRQPPQVGRRGTARERESGGGIGVVDQARAVEPALRAALAAPDVGPSHLGLGGRDRRQRTTGSVQVDRPERLAGQRRRVRDAGPGPLDDCPLLPAGDGQRAVDLNRHPDLNRRGDRAGAVDRQLREARAVGPRRRGGRRAYGRLGRRRVGRERAGRGERRHVGSGLRARPGGGDPGEVEQDDGAEQDGGEAGDRADRDLAALPHRVRAVAVTSIERPSTPTGTATRIVRSAT